MPDAVWKIGKTRTLPLNRPRIMAILNITPDSFSDGGILLDPRAAAAAAERAAVDGADILDVGGESTRPGATAVGVAEQIDRVVPAIEAIRKAGVELPISIDTTRAAVARAAMDAADGRGATIINDQSAGADDEQMFALAAERRAGLVLMHRLRVPADDSFSDQYASGPEYEDVVRVVRTFLAERVEGAQAAGVPQEAVLVDPGLGFGKTVEQNVALVRGSRAFIGMGAGLLSAASRKSFVGRVSLDRDSQPSERLAGSIAFSVVHLAAGARVFRVHDVRQQAAALRAAWRLLAVGDRV